MTRESRETSALPQRLRNTSHDYKYHRQRQAVNEIIRKIFWESFLGGASSSGLAQSGPLSPIADSSCIMPDPAFASDVVCHIADNFGAMQVILRW